MFKNIRPAWAEINLDNIEFNIKEIKKITRSKNIVGVVKADGYGHGAIEVAPILLENGVSRLAVAIITEAIELRNSEINDPIMILGATPVELMRELIKYDIEQTVFSYEYAKELSKVAKDNNKTAKIHIAVDTGMGRIGFIPGLDSVKEIEKISKLPNVKIIGMFSHFSTADEKNKEYSKLQFKKYNEFYNALKEKGIHIGIRHIANSAAIIDLPETHYEGARPGIILYGYYPSNEVNKENLKLKKAMELKTKIVHIKTIDEGSYVSYGRKFESKRESKIATLPIGYADGYTRALLNKGKVIINGQLAPVIGNICMDQCMIDITDIKGDVFIGDEVILMGEKDGLKFDADDIAKALGTINYEVLCMISKRIPRVYIKNGKIIKVKNYV